MDFAAPAGSRVAGLRGLVSCGSVWACPRCAAVIGQERADELQRGIEEWEERGKRVVMLTQTIGHEPDQPLADVWKGLTASWQDFNRDRRWKDIKARAGVHGYVRATEATYSKKNGWHVHAHVLLFVEDAQAMLDETVEVVRLWVRMAERNGYRAVAQGQDMRVATAGDAYEVANYVNKGSVGKRAWTAADETMRWSVKRGRGESVAPFELLMDAAVGDLDARGLWAEWEYGSHGKRQITWSRGLRKDLGLQQEATDQEVSDAANPAPEDQAQEILDNLDRGTPEIGGISNVDWSLMFMSPENLAAFLEAVEYGTEEEAVGRIRQLAQKRDFPLMVGEEWNSHRELARERRGMRD